MVWLEIIILIVLIVGFIQLRRDFMATMLELQTTLEAIDAKLTEAGTEIPAKLQELRDLIAASGPGTTPEIDALIATLTAKATGLADVVSDSSPQP
jgi:hypothetical protein